MTIPHPLPGRFQFATNKQEQDGAHRAAYGAKLLSELSSYLTERCGKGWSVGNLKNARQLFMVYSPEIRKSVIGEFENRQSLYDFFKISWTHYIVLMRIKDKHARHSSLLSKIVF